jgi:hypothetical protein
MATTTDLSGLHKKIAAATSVKHEVMKQALPIFIANTPKHSGNARRNTRLDGQDVIQAAYGYASRLDAGSSNQAPRGMTEPTIKEIKKIVQSVIKKVVK